MCIKRKKKKNNTTDRKTHNAKNSHKTKETDQESVHVLPTAPAAAAHRSLRPPTLCSVYRSALAQRLPAAYLGQVSVINIFTGAQISNEARCSAADFAFLFTSSTTVEYSAKVAGAGSLPGTAREVAYQRTYRGGFIPFRVPSCLSLESRPS